MYIYIYIIYTDPHLPMSNHIFMYSCPQKDAAGAVFPGGTRLMHLVHVSRFPNFLSNWYYIDCNHVWQPQHFLGDNRKKHSSIHIFLPYTFLSIRDMFLGI